MNHRPFLATLLAITLCPPLTGCTTAVDGSNTANSAQVNFVVVEASGGG